MPQTDVDLPMFYESYVAVRCRRPRGVTDDNVHHPGYCRMHARTEAWREIEYPARVMLTYMMDGSRCSISSFSQFLIERQQLFANVTVDNVLDLLFTPTGVMCVSGAYFNAALAMYLQYMQSVSVNEQIMSSQPNPELLAALQRPNGLVAFFQRQFDNAELDYDFLAQRIARLSPWLANSTVRWNMLFNKITLMISTSFFPVEFHPRAARFSSRTIEVWRSILAGTTDQRLLESFLLNLDELVRSVNDTFADVPRGQLDPRPHLDGATVLQPLSMSCVRNPKRKAPPEDTPEPPPPTTTEQSLFQGL